jgi:ATPase family associated with various cellular activities (AAA)
MSATTLAPTPSVLLQQANLLQQEFDWLQHTIDSRLQHYFAQESREGIDWEITLNHSISDYSNTFYAQLIQRNNLNTAERLVLLLALAPVYQPALLDYFFVRNATYDRPFTEFGGVRNTQHQGFIPTVETALFLLGGNNLQTRLFYEHFFASSHTFSKNQILQLSEPLVAEPPQAVPLVVSAATLGFLRHGQTEDPVFGSDFPAKKIQTTLTWNDLVLPNSTLEKIEEINDWIQYGDTLLHSWGLSKHLGGGYKSLFYGPSGTGKTLTVSLLGKYCHREVYRVDLSMVVSKFIGETEKNLSKVFAQAENKNWILFFDEADALFGKRTKIEDAHDKYANQEVSYLLQRMEEFEGVVILASNMKDNLDEAFLRRFQSVVYFPIPPVAERLRLWQSTISEKAQLEPDVNLGYFAQQYDLTGGTILNIVRMASLRAIKRGDGVIRYLDLEEGIRREFAKEGKSY